MKTHLSTQSLAALALALGTLVAAPAVQARDDVSFSFSVQTPGYFVQPQPMYAQPTTVYSNPFPVYVQPGPVYLNPFPVYVAPQPVYTPMPGYYGRRDRPYGDQRGFYGNHDRGGYGNFYGNHSPRQPRQYSYIDDPYGDLDRDGIRNRHDRDRDGDGVRNRDDRRPNNPYRY